MEFTHFKSFFISGNIACIYDAMSKKIISYELNGQYLNTISLNDIYYEITPN